MIRAWIAQAESWNHPHAVRSCAPAGIAAVNFEGTTIASLYNGNSVSREKQLGFLGCLLLVVDEISMAGHRVVRNLDKFLSGLRGGSFLLAGQTSCLQTATASLPRSSGGRCSNNRQTKPKAQI